MAAQAPKMTRVVAGKRKQKTAAQAPPEKAPRRVGRHVEATGYVFSRPLKPPGKTPEPSYEERQAAEAAEAARILSTRETVEAVFGQHCPNRPR